MTTPSKASTKAYATSRSANRTSLQDEFTNDDKEDARPQRPQPTADLNNLNKVPQIFQSRQHAIRYFCHLFGAPVEEEWEESGIIPAIMMKMEMPRHQYRTVIRVLEKIVEQEDAGRFKGYNPTSRQTSNSGAFQLSRDVGTSYLTTDLLMTS
jgi:hypothetical protein